MALDTLRRWIPDPARSRLNVNIIRLFLDNSRAHNGKERSRDFLILMRLFIVGWKAFFAGLKSEWIDGEEALFI